jgi:hypothetical protein
MAEERRTQPTAFGAFVLVVLTGAGAAALIGTLVTGQVLVPSRDGFFWLSWGRSPAAYLAALGFWLLIAAGCGAALVMRLMRRR